jgi:hypothetical protein
MRRMARLVLPAVAAGLALLLTGTAAHAATWSSTDQWATWSNGGFTLYNDLWGSGHGPQTIWANSYSNWGVWSQQPNTSGVKSYPNVSKSVSGTAVGSLHTVSGSFNVTRPGTGSYNTAYDIWLGNNAYEIMLWMNKQGSVGPLGSLRTTVSVGGHTWNVYSGSNGANTVYSFVRTSNTNSGSVNILAVLQWLRTNGWYGNVGLNQVQFGWEITSTNNTGQNFMVNSYSLSVS